MRVRGDLVEVRRDPLDALGRGAVLVFAVAPLATASVYLGGALFGLDGGLGTLALVLAAALAGGVPGLVGLGMMLVGRTPKTVAVLDLGERLITRGARTEVLRDVDAVAVQRAGGRWRLVLAGAHPITLLSVHGARGAALSEAAEALADAMDLPVAMPDQALRARGRGCLATELRQRLLPRRDRLAIGIREAGELPGKVCGSLVDPLFTECRRNV